MSRSDKKRRKIPRQRALATELCPEAQRQWEIFLKKRSSLRRIIYYIAGARREHVDDIDAKVALALYTRLLNGPLKESEKVEAYLTTITRRHAHKHFADLAGRAENFVGDDTTQLEDAAAGFNVNLASRVELVQAMQVLREEFSPLQLKAFVLAEAYGLQAPLIAELIGGETTSASVRDALRHARRKLGSKRVGLRLGVLAEE
ncbi:RNA polymerase sigma factor [Streptomyces lydicus]